MPFDSRPDAPSPDLLYEAQRELASRLSVEATGLRWEIAERLDRKRSTLFPLTLRSAAGEALATAYFKAPYFPDAHERPRRNLERMRAALSDGRRLESRFEELAGGTGISINVTLAFDPNTLETITRGLEGRPMGNPAAHVISTTRRAAALRTCSQVGAAAGILEQFAVADPEAHRERIWGETQRKLAASSSILSAAEAATLESHMAQLLDGAYAEPNPVTLAHGDLGPSNVLVLPEGTGLIDFMWIPQLRGFDLARFVHRLSSATLSLRPWTSSLVEATLEGYGDRSAPGRAGWRFSALQRLLATALDHPKRRRGLRRALARTLSSAGDTDG